MNQVGPQADSGDSDESRGRGAQVWLDIGTGRGRGGWVSCCLSPHNLESIVFWFSFFKKSFGCTLGQVGSDFPDHGSNPCPLCWKRRVLTTGLPGKSQESIALENQTARQGRVLLRPYRSALEACRHLRRRHRNSNDRADTPCEACTWWYTAH